MESNKFKLKLTIYKKDQMRYFSQLDLVKIFDRALRRTHLPLYFTKGFNPHVKMSFKRALKLGVEGSVEVVFYFSEQISASLLKERLMLQLPQGLQIITVESNE